MKHPVRITYNSPVILTFTALAFAATLLGLWTKGASTRLAFCVYRSSPLSLFFYVRLFCHVLGHSSFAHFAGNAMYLLLVGPTVEERYGSKKLVGMIAVTALVTGLLQIALFPGTALLGASGIVFLLIILCSATNFSRGEIPLTLILVAVLFLGQEIVTSLTVQDSISQFCHVVGGVMGIVFALTDRRANG